MAGSGNPTRDLDTHIVSLLTKISEMREQSQQHQRSNGSGVLGNVVSGQVGGARHSRKPAMGNEARSLELWKAVAVECLGTFIFTLIVSGAASSSGAGLSVLATAIATGFAMAAISLIFGNVSGELLNQYIYVFL